MKGEGCQRPSLVCQGAPGKPGGNTKKMAVIWAGAFARMSGKLADDYGLCQRHRLIFKVEASCQAMVNSLLEESVDVEEYRELAANLIIEVGKRLGDCQFDYEMKKSKLKQEEREADS